MDSQGLAIPLLSFAGVLAWLAVLGRLRHSDADTRIGASILIVAILLFASSALYLGAPQAWSTATIVTARIVLLASACLILLRR